MNAVPNMQAISLETFRKKIKKGGIAYTDGERALKIAEVAAKLGVSVSTVRRLKEKEGFPKAIRFSESTVRWLESGIDAWMHSRKGIENEQ